MKETKQMEYHAPQIETINVRVEKGYTQSVTPDDTMRSLNTEGVGNSNNNYDNNLFT